MGPTMHPHDLRIVGADRPTVWLEVMGPAFSAASRDPVQRRFASIDDYFRRGPGGTVHEEILVRVWVRDETTGRQALLWDAYHAGGQLLCGDVDPGDLMRPHLPEGSCHVRQADYLPIYSLALPGQALRACMGFYVRPEAGQEGVAEADKMWRVAGGDHDNSDDHNSFFNLQFHEDVTEAQLASFITSLLQP
jgi:hypothetical protein